MNKRFLYKTKQIHPKNLLLHGVKSIPLPYPLSLGEGTSKPRHSEGWAEDFWIKSNKFTRRISYFTWLNQTLSPTPSPLERGTSKPRHSEG